MITWLTDFAGTVLDTLRDVLPIMVLFVGFQLLLFRQSFSNPRQLLSGFFFVLIGLAFFLKGLEQALFPLGRVMAQQLTNPEFTLVDYSVCATCVYWQDYIWVYVFAAAIGFATTIAEPSLIAVALKARQVSGGSIQPWGLRIAVAIGVAVGISLGTWRIVTGTELYVYIIVGYVVVIIQTYFSPKMIIGLAYDSGGVTTSTVTVPLVAALGLGLASNVPGRDPLLDGFGLIAFASLFPIMAVLAYAWISEWLMSRDGRRAADSGDT